MQIDKVISNRIKKIEEYLSHLQEIKKASREEFLNNWRLQDIAIRNLQISIEACLDIANHIISINKFDTPETYIETINILEKENILTKKTSELMKNFVKFRNIIVHDYLYLDMSKIYENLQKIDKIKEFIAEILK